MRDTEYYVELRKEARELKANLMKEYRGLINKTKEPNVSFESDEKRKEYHIELNKQMSQLRTRIDILNGQITVFNSILNYDTPIVLGENVQFKL